MCWTADTPSGNLGAMDADGWTTYGDLTARDWVTLTDAQRSLVAVGELRTEINNGGFDQYLFNSGGDLAPIARDAASDAGLTVLAELIDRALAVLGSGYSTDRDQRQAALEAVTDRTVFDELDREYYEVESTVDLDAFMNALARSA